MCRCSRALLRKKYGPDAQSMTDGSFQMQMFSWPTGEFGGMSRFEDALNYTTNLQSSTIRMNTRAAAMALEKFDKG